MKIRMDTIRGGSLIKAVGFSGASGNSATLRTQFDDATLDFAKVPFAIFKALVRKQRPFTFLPANIYGAYSYEKL